MKKEILVFLVIFLILTIGMHHEQWFSYPIEHLKNLPSAGAYGIGAIHPLVFTFVIYIIVWIPRSISKLLKRAK